MILDKALELSKKGFYIFPLRVGSKLPATQGFAEIATRDENKLREWWGNNPNFNIGLYTGKFNGDGETLVAIDVDAKDGKLGFESLEKLKEDGVILPDTFYQTTPTGGKHLIYKSTIDFANGVNKLGPGLDIRGKGGYLVGAGSIIDGKEYYCFDFEVADATEQLVARLNRAKERKPQENIKLEINADRAISRAQRYLETAPIARQGEGGTTTTYMVACSVKDFGLTANETMNVMWDWNKRCEPPWGADELRNQIDSAFKYGQEAPGSKNPEVLFKEEVEEQADDPITEINKRYAYVVMGGKGFILEEKNNEISFLLPQTFHTKLKSKTLMFNGKVQQLSNIWIASAKRRTYDGVCFEPKEVGHTNKYNLWRGFTVKQKPADNFEAELALDLFLTHVKENVCHGNIEHFNWLITFFSHLIQKPQEKPIVAIVLRGQKGVGKNILVETIGHLLGPYFYLTSSSRYLLGNFNSHLERCLMFVLDEAFWSGNKAAEGALKDIVTGTNHFIERKGIEAYTSKNLTRVLILGNEDWLVPATNDERRFAVFDVGNYKRNNIEFFEGILNGMKAGGYEALFDYLMTWDLTTSNIKIAPQTIGLMNQKVSSLSVFNEFWLECLKDGKIVNSTFSEEWCEQVPTNELRQAHRLYSKEKGVTNWLASDEEIGKSLKKCLPEVKRGRLTTDSRPRTYVLGSLAEARKAWDNFMGHNFDWQTETP